MTDTPRSNAISPVVFMGSGGPDLTAPEAVERLAKNTERAMQKILGVPFVDCEEAATLRALSAALLDVSKREAAMIARYDAKLEAAERVLEREKTDHRNAIARHGGKVRALKARAEDLDAKLKEAVELLNEPVAMHRQQWWVDARNAFLASIGDKP